MHFLATYRLILLLKEVGMLFSRKTLRSLKSRHHPEMEGFGHDAEYIQSIKDQHEKRKDEG